MAKKRLNKGHRALMENLVRQTVNHDEKKISAADDDKESS